MRPTRLAIFQVISGSRKPLIARKADEPVTGRAVVKRTQKSITQRRKDAEIAEEKRYSVRDMCL
ncbi:MAG: hypothetical protein EA370_12750, partial [Wenzhouxiangella sp.]